MARSFWKFLIFCFIYSSTAVAGGLHSDQFIDPETCGDCHEGIYSQWQNSMHNLAHKDILYTTIAKSLLGELTDKNEKEEGESCVKCHTPIGYITGNPLKLSDPDKKIPKIAKKGIQCDYCHSAIKASKPYNNGLVIEPGNGEDDPGIKRGPRSDSSSDFHDTAFSSLHTKSLICGTCHDVKHIFYNTPLESTYTEWQKSPYNSEDENKKITCQGCHMYQRKGEPATGSTQRLPNKGKSTEEGKERSHIFTHNFVGGNAALPALSGDSIKSQLASDRLKHAAELSLNADNLKQGKISITIKNTGAGHYLPTGLTDVRQMWLSISITNKKGKKIYSVGEPDSRGYLQKNTKLFNTVFGDGKGKPVANISKAREILSDHRIPPLKSLTENFSFKPIKKGKYKISVKLLYRSSSQKLVYKALGNKKIMLPVIEMATLNKLTEL